MTSLRRLEANRRNAQRSTGPRTRRGKLTSRGNALCQGLTAEAVISAEECAAYEAFEAALLDEFIPQAKD